MVRAYAQVGSNPSTVPMKHRLKSRIKEKIRRYERGKAIMARHKSEVGEAPEPGGILITQYNKVNQSLLSDWQRNCVRRSKDIKKYVRFNDL